MLSKLQRIIAHNPGNLSHKLKCKQNYYYNPNFCQFIRVPFNRSEK